MTSNQHLILGIRISSVLPWLVLLLAACQPQQVRVPTPEKVFAKGRKLTYSVTRFAPGSRQAHPDTLTLTSYGDYKAGQYDTSTTQIKVGFGYDAHSAPDSFAGVIENNSMLWSHPPRQGIYTVLELSPYPYLKLPVAAGKQWTWDLTVGDQWNNAQWASWHGDMLVRSSYHVVGQQAIQTKFGLLSCWVVQAKATCSVGNSTLDIFYHPAYGFIRLNYQTITGSRILFTLIKTSVEELNDPLPLPTYAPSLAN